MSMTSVILDRWGNTLQVGDTLGWSRRLIEDALPTRTAEKILLFWNK